MSSGLIWCSMPGATVGLVVRDDVVVDCPPYARRWALDRPAALVCRIARARGAELRWVPDGER